MLVSSSPYKSPAVISLSDNLLMVHYKEVRESFSVDLADVPFDAAGNLSMPAVSHSAVSKLTITAVAALPEAMCGTLEDPSFAYPAEEKVPYHSYEVQIASANIGLELESAFQKWVRGVCVSVDCSCRHMTGACTGAWTTRRT